MNKKGQTVMIGIMIAITVFITVISFIPVLKPEITRVRSASHLDCGNTSISVATRMTCIVVDIWLFNFIGTALAAGIAFITGKSLIYKTRQ